MLERGGPGKTICSSDVARALGGTEFRTLMNTARAPPAERVRRQSSSRTPLPCAAQRPRPEPA
ncbi:MAG: DUF3253 domain-containing protein [Solirubrobacteraceae bacterium]